MKTKTFQDRELAILMDWLERYPATLVPPTPYNECWLVGFGPGGKYMGIGTNPVAALRDYRKAMLSSRRRPKATDTTDTTDGAA